MRQGSIPSIRKWNLILARQKENTSVSLCLEALALPSVLLPLTQSMCLSGEFLHGLGFQLPGLGHLQNLGLNQSHHVSLVWGIGVSVLF